MAKKGHANLLDRAAVKGLNVSYKSQSFKTVYDLFLDFFYFVTDFIEMIKINQP